MSILENVEPQNVFRYFEEISRIPHGSYHTKAISDYLVRFAEEHELEFYQDEHDNVILIKEASGGYEEAEPLIIQGHIDMVCEKEAGCEIDFETEGLELFVDGDFLRAKGTTLGGDDGIAVAYALAILDDDTLSHPRLEVVLTSNEEVGLLGAKSIDLSRLQGRILLNIDSDVEGHFLTACAGGLTARMELPVARHKAEGVGVMLRIYGLLGGHSGSEIDKEHANAILVMGRILEFIGERMDVGLVSAEGGYKDNAIPREADIVLLIPKDKRELLEQCAGEILDVLKKEYSVSDPDLSLSFEFLEEQSYDALDADSLQKVLFFLRTLPNGVMHQSVRMKGLVETSLNAGIMKLKDHVFCLTSSVRSSVESRKRDLFGRLSCLAAYLGGSICAEGDYPAWEYCETSKIREKAAAVYRNMYGKEPVFEAIHAGLECGIFSDKIKGLDAISFGPDNFDIHTPKERLSISSAERVYRFLTELIGSLKE